MLLFMLLAQDPSVQTGAFVDVTQTAGLAAPSCSWGFTLGDYDNDGDPDLYLSNHVQSSMRAMGLPMDNTLYRNDGGMSFSRLGREAADANTDDAHHVAWVDLDRDGDLDLVVVQGTPKKGGPFTENYHNRVFINEGGALRDLPLQGDAAGITWRTRGGVWTDLDIDGDADFVGAGVVSTSGRPGSGTLILMNEGPPNLVGASKDSGMQRSTEESFQVSASDVDQDGHIDLLVTPSLGLYLNRGDGTYSEETQVRGLDPSLDISATHWGDYDQDGDDDLLVAVTNMILVPHKGYSPARAGLRLYRNDGKGHFEDVSSLLGPTASGLSRSAVFGDVDNDGDLDIFAVAGPAGAPHRLLLNSGEAGAWRFQDMGAALGLRGPAQAGASDSALADLDGDGRLDIFVSQGAGDCKSGTVGTPQLWHNQLPTGHWLGVSLVGRSAEPNGLGARVIVRTASGDLHRTMSGPHHYLSQDSLPLHFGLGANEQVEEILVLWNTGELERFAGGPADRSLRLVQGAGRPMSLASAQSAQDEQAQAE